MTGKRNNQTSPVGSPTSGNISDGSNSKEQDRFLPIANVSRIMKKALPANAKISKEAKETVQECVSEFISFITGEASDKCQREKRKTINGDDLLWAMTTLGFENYVGPLKGYLNSYRETEGEKSNNCSVAKPEDHDDAGVVEINNKMLHSSVDFATSFNGGGGFYSSSSVGSQQLAPKTTSFQEIGGNNIRGYSEISSMNRAIAQSVASGDQDASGNRMMPYRVQW
ncbi:nuclear transcription factor Y subunit B-1-like [Lotus japonicus]|uniref:nuclear transcription factor Y subunit B-1-like n=1 Tax=Lotus japonicus TaxID=34305 RepID=UPI00258D9EFE|nr:nuclear transcription factor Y subunit B-1-like [Lotus japonicus]